MIANLSVRHFDVPVRRPPSGLRTSGTSASLEKMYLGVADDAKSILVGFTSENCSARPRLSAHTFGR